MGTCSGHPSMVPTPECVDVGGLHLPSWGSELTGNQPFSPSIPQAEAGQRCRIPSPRGWALPATPGEPSEGVPLLTDVWAAMMIQPLGLWRKTWCPWVLLICFLAVTWRWKEGGWALQNCSGCRRARLSLPGLWGPSALQPHGVDPGLTRSGCPTSPRGHGAPLSGLCVCDVGQRAP